MSNVKYMEMEDIAYKEWSDHLDFVASSRASPWLPAYGYHTPSPIQEIFHSQPDPFLSVRE
ncbi:hypothetical protein RUM43_010338 [Polyplax serrata]|uniref:Uncharacterized protein n=1 Tax=Polyplax serrata TaxID=468196 RepID=A0AAN8PVP1_POLSC